MKRKFIRQGTGKKKLELKWRRPRGIHSKLRLNKAGHRKRPSIGFKSQRKSNEQITIITNINDLKNAKQSILLSSKLGLKTKLEILKVAAESKFKVLNIKNVEEFIKKAKDELEKKRTEKKKKETEKKKSKEKAVKEAESSKQKKQEESTKIQK